MHPDCYKRTQAGRPMTPLASGEIVLSAIECATTPKLLAFEAIIWCAALSRTETVRMVLDTGAYFSEIDEALLGRLGYPTSEQRARSVRIHNGRDSEAGRLVAVRRLGVGPAVVSDLDVAIRAFDPRLEFKGLIGLNFLSVFPKFEVDLKSRRLTLHPSPTDHLG